MTDKNKQSDEKPTFFVSRRGRQVGVHQVDLTGMDIDSEEPAKPFESPKQKPKPTKEKRIRQPRQWTKKKSVILVVVIAFLVLPLVAAELVAAQYRQGSGSARNELSSLINQTVLPAQKKNTVSSGQIGTVADQVNDIVGRMCRGGLLDNAAQLYPRAKAALTDCKDNQRLFAALASNLYDLEKQAQYLESMGALMKPVTTPITDEYAVIAAQQTAWQIADKGLKNLSAPGQMKTAHSSLSGHVSAVATAWSALNTANNTQDRNGFTEAEQKLATEYEAIRESSSSFTEVLAGQQAKVTASYNLIK